MQIIGKESDITYIVFGFLMTTYVIATNILVYPFLIISLLIYSLTRGKYSALSIFLAIFIIFYLINKALTNELVASILTVKYFLGFFLFFLFFKNYQNININFSKLVSLIAISVIIEALLVNTIIPKEYWLHYPVDNLSHSGLFWGVYQRPYGIATSPTVTSSLIVILMTLADYQEKNKYHKIKNFHTLAITAVLASLSGTGFFLLILYLIIRYKLFSIFALVFSIPIVALVIINQLSINISLFEKISPEYVFYLIEYKLGQIYDLFNIESLYSIFFGVEWNSNDPMPLGGDLGFLNIYNYGGVAILLLYLYLSIYIYSNKKFNITLSLFLISCFHYTAMFSLLGQILFGYILAISNNKN